MKALASLLYDLGSTSNAGPAAHSVTLTPPLGTQLAALLRLTGTAQTAPTVQVRQNGVMLGQTLGFDRPLLVTFPNPTPLSAQISWNGWGTGVELTVSYFSGVRPPQPLQAGMPLTLGASGWASLWLGDGERAGVQVQGAVNVYRDGRLLPAAASPRELLGPGLYLFEALTPDATLAWQANLPPPAPEPTAPAPPADVQPFPADGVEAVTLGPGQPQRFAFQVPDGAYLELVVEGSARLRAQLTQPDRTRVQGQGERVRLCVPCTQGGLHVLEVQADEEAEFTARRLVALPSAPGEYRISSHYAGEAHAWLLRAEEGQELRAHLDRPEGAHDRPRLSLGLLGGPVLAQTAYYSELRQRAPQSGTYLLRADDSGTPYSNLTLFIDSP